VWLNEVHLAAVGACTARNSSLCARLQLDPDATCVRCAAASPSRDANAGAIMAKPPRARRRARAQLQRVQPDCEAWLRGSDHDIIDVTQ